LKSVDLIVASAKQKRENFWEVIFGELLGQEDEIKRMIVQKCPRNFFASIYRYNDRSIELFFD